MGEWKVTGCNYCGLSCNLEACVENNHITNIRPNPRGARNPGPYLCRKGRGSRYFQENPERLNHPLKKVGDHFEQISWEQAYKEIAERANAIIDKHGPRSFAYLGGTLAGDHADAAMAQFMLKAVGSQYMYNPIGIEFAGHWWSNGRIFGHQGYAFDEERGDLDAFIFWGHNGYVSHQIPAVRFLIKKLSEDPDKKVIVVDPRLSETARMADIHVMPKPGTDALLVRALISLIVQKGWEDREYLKKWCFDWETAKKWYTDFDYKSAFEVCEVPLSQMEEFAKFLATHTWAVHQDLGIYCGRNNTMSSFLIDTLCVITGNALIKGNSMFEQCVPFTDQIDERTPGIWRTVEKDAFPVAGIYPPVVLPDEILSEKKDHLRCVFFSQTNPIMSFPNSQRLRKAFEHLDLLVGIDCVPTESTQYCDYILPGKTGFEAYQFSFFSSETAYLKHPILDQIEERRENTRIWLDIMKAMGKVPEMSQSVYDAAAKSVKDRDIIPFLVKGTMWFSKHKEYKDYMNLALVDAMARPEALGSVTRAIFRLAMVTSPQGMTKFCDRAGFQNLPKYNVFNHLGKLRQFSGMSKMDQVFWALDDTPDGLRIGVKDPNPETYTYDHIFYPDHKLRLFDETIDRHIKNITAEKEAAALKREMADFPMILSSGNHADGGDNATMRNPESYKYRKPYFLMVNPDDAVKMNLSNGEIVKLSTKAGSVEAPVEISFRCGKGYCILPHHYGMEKDGKIFYGAKANDLTNSDDYDPITGDPYIRWVPCRIDKLEA